MKDADDRVTAIQGISRVLAFKPDSLIYQAPAKRKQKIKPSQDEDTTKDSTCQVDKNGKIDCNA